MPKSRKTSRMQNSCWVNHYKLVFMTGFAATVTRVGRAQQSRPLASIRMPRSARTYVCTVVKASNEGKTIVVHLTDASISAP